MSDTDEAVPVEQSWDRLHPDTPFAFAVAPGLPLPRPGEGFVVTYDCPHLEDRRVCTMQVVNVSSEDEARDYAAKMVPEFMQIPDVEFSILGVTRTPSR